MSPSISPREILSISPNGTTNSSPPTVISPEVSARSNSWSIHPVKSTPTHTNNAENALFILLFDKIVIFFRFTPTKLSLIFQIKSILAKNLYLWSEIWQKTIKYR